MDNMKNVFAHYFTWFARKDISGRWEHWNWDGPGIRHNPDIIVDGHEDIASIDVPIIGAYDSSDSTVHKYHLDLAAKAGIDAFTVDWYGSPDDDNKNRDNIVDRNFDKMLHEAREHTVKLCICYEEKLLFNKKTDLEAVETGKRHMTYISEKYFSSKGYWKVNERPVVIVWGNNTLKVTIWEEILSVIKQYNPWIIYSHHDHNPDYVEICDGFYPWVLVGSLRKQAEYLDNYYETAGRYHNEEKSTTFCGGVWPGFNDSGVSGWGSGNRIIEDSEDELYRLTWDYVLKYNPEWVSITTWNDWNEGSNVEPGLKKGTKYLEMTADFIQRYKEDKC